MQLSNCRHAQLGPALDTLASAQGPHVYLIGRPTFFLGASSLSCSEQATHKSLQAVRLQGNFCTDSSACILRGSASGINLRKEFIRALYRRDFSFNLDGFLQVAYCFPRPRRTPRGGLQCFDGMQAAGLSHWLVLHTRDTQGRVTTGVGQLQARPIQAM